MKAILISLALFVFANAVMAQEDGTLQEQTIVIFNDFTPILKDASRIQSTPTILDTIKVEPKFEYSVMPTMYKTSFTPSKIPAATIKGETLKPLNTGMVKVGFGNYTSPFFEGFVNSKRQKNYVIGLNAKHQSSFGKIKNSLDQKIYSGYDDSRVEAYGKKIMAKSVLSGNVYFSSNGRNYYGYNPAVYGDVSTIDWTVFDYADKKDEIEKQRFNRAGANFRFESENNALKHHMDYLFNVNYQYFFAKSKDQQHKVDFVANLGGAVKKVGYGIDINMIYNYNKFANSDILHELTLNTTPNFRFTSDKWKIRAGVNACGELLLDTVKYHFYPDAFVQLNISNTILPYISYNGHLDNNNMEFVSRINPYVMSISNYKSTSYQHDANVGIKFNISKKIFLHLNVNYQHIDDMVFFVNDTVTTLKNHFDMEYTDVDRIGPYAELSLKNLVQGLEITLKGRYYYYLRLANGERPWQMPDIDISLRAAYKLTKNISFGLETYFLNSCYAKEYDAAGFHENKMRAVVDVDLFGEYQFGEKFSVFLYLNNIACQRYYIWNNYRAQGFNALAGLRYVF
ncbi:MAG: TonB-dependent receptor [Bacteroidales bacterium]|nr:TonB-dependent receptor [Bacteroidales bacterium]